MHRYATIKVARSQFHIEVWSKSVQIHRRFMNTVHYTILLTTYIQTGSNNLIEQSDSLPRLTVERISKK